MNVLVVGPRVSLRRLTPWSKAAHVTLRVASSAGELDTRLRDERPDLVLVYSHMPRFAGHAIVGQVLACDPALPILVIRDMGALRLDLFAQVLGRSGHPVEQSPAARDLVGHALALLHHPGSGRVDARRVSAFLGVPLAELARLICRSPQSVHKTPDAPAIQHKLSVFARIATSLSTLYGTPEHARVWLNSPNPDLDKARPIELLKERKAEAVAELLEDALLGHPG